jgi:hypothetical protein
VTVVAAGPLERDEHAKSWLEQCRRSEDNRDGECDDALLSLNKVISAHRIAAADPYAHEVTPGHAQVVRLGYGTGEEMVGGLWRAAYTLPCRRRRSSRRAMLAPQEELVAIIRERRPSQPRSRRRVERPRNCGAGRRRSSPMRRCADP